jgi:RHS repeat-associated protein
MSEGTVTLPARPAAKLHGASRRILSTCRAIQVVLALCLGATSDAHAATAPATVTPACNPSLQCCAGNPGTGSTCGGSGVASQGNTSGTDQGAGNPINVITGNKYQREVDLSPLPGVLGLEIVRHYNSALSGGSGGSGISGPLSVARDGGRLGILGRGWKLSYETLLRVDPGSQGNTIVIEQADGTRAALFRGLGMHDIFVPGDPGQGRLVRRSKPPGFTYQWQWANGRVLDFDQGGRLVNITAPTGEFVGLDYDDNGLLYKVTDPQGRTLSLHYADAGNLRKGAPRHGYYRGVQDIDTPVGRFSYHYGSPALLRGTVHALALQASLVRVDLPTGYHSAEPALLATSRDATVSMVSRLYLYEDAAFPTLLTGISVQGQGSDGQFVSQRVATYGYDGAGRGNLSVRGEPARLEAGKDGKLTQPVRLVAGTGIEQVTLVFHGVPGRPGETIVTNSLAQATTYRHMLISGKPRLIEVRGAGCAACGPANMRYGYDRYGRLVEETVLAIDGKPRSTTRTEYDGAQRVRQISTVAWQAGKPQRAQWRVRYDYPAYAKPTSHEAAPLPPGAPSVIARPSVVPGNEHQLRMAYNEMGQPLEVEEIGFSPLDETGKPVSSATDSGPERIRRTTRYAYQIINGRSLLASIDGPLPNGPLESPLDSDISRLEWDNSGSHIVALTFPGGMRSRLKVDAAGRPIDVSDAEGRRTTLRYDPLGHLIGFSRTATDMAKPTSEWFRYDAYGNAVERGSGGTSGKEVGTSSARDKRASSSGARGDEASSDSARDNEAKSGVAHGDKATSSDAGDIEAASGDARGIEAASGDARGIEATSGDARGIEATSGPDLPDYRPRQRVGFDWLGRQIWQASALGILQQRRYDTESRLVESAVLDGGMRSSLHATWDSTGNLASLRNNSGALLRLRHDAAGRLNGWTDALGRDHNAGAASWQAPRAHTLRDDFGRAVATFSPDSGLITRSFDGADRLVASSDALGNRAVYAHDVFGRIERQVITPAEPAAKASTTRWVYRGQQLAALEHAEQSERYRLDVAGRLASRAIAIQAFDGKQVTSITRYDYGDDGQLQRTRLPDGSWLRVQRNGQGQVVGLLRDRIGTAWLGWLLPTQTMVTDIKRDLVGPRSFVTGNGIEARFQRSREGVLARVVHAPLRRGGGHGVDRVPLPGAHAASLPLMATHAAMPPAFGSGAGSGSNGSIPAAGTRLIASASPVTSGITPVHSVGSGFGPGVDPGALPGALGLPADPAALLDYRYLWDAQGNLLHTQGKAGGGAPDTGYAWDGRDRLIVAANASDVSRFLYDQRGNRLLSQQGIKDQHDLTTGTVHPAWRAGTNQWLAEGALQADWDVSGQPQRIGTRHTKWDALGKLVETRQEQKPTVHYVYNHRGERIRKDDGTQGTSYLYEQGQLSAELDEHGRITRQYIYLADQPIAVLDTPTGLMPYGEERSILEQIAADIAVAFHAWFNDDAQLAFLHANHLGAIEVATGADGKPIWRAQYGPFGQVVRIGALVSSSSSKRQFRLRLRLPGQYEDEETGLYYNGQRYYDPQRGRYLTPDPLGTPDGPNGYAYVRGNPLRYVDPDGLILFAFDGTDNSNPPPGVDDFSNVYKFYQAYDETQNGRKWYMNGVGRNDPDSGIKTNLFDEADANTARARVDYMLRQLDTYMAQNKFQKDEEVDIDIVGFSRGAAMSRDFANKVAQRLERDTYRSSGTCAEIRFLGVWDTVAQFGLDGLSNSQWQMAIPVEVEHAFQAVALNENRRLFPGESIDRGVQRGFIGSHADIGGSYGTGDLSDVALNWIYDQAKSSGVKMRTWTDAGNEEWGIISNPVLHDKSNGVADRDFCLRANNQIVATNCQKQRVATPGGMTWSQTASFINIYSMPLKDADGTSRIVGQVNMEEYNAWLKENYGFELQVATR